MFRKEQKRGRRSKQWTFCMDRDSSDCWKMQQKCFTIWEIYFKKQQKEITTILKRFDHLLAQFHHPKDEAAVN